MIIDILNGVPVVNEQEKPKVEDYRVRKGPTDDTIIAPYYYDRILPEWEANCKPVENAERAGYPDKWFVWLDEFYELLTGQQVQAEERDGKIYVIKLL